MERKRQRNGGGPASSSDAKTHTKNGISDLCFMVNHTKVNVTQPRKCSRSSSSPPLHFSLSLSLLCECSLAGDSAVVA